MGSQDGDADERPAHKVQVNAFSMDVYEVTVRQYAEFLRAEGFNSPLDWKTMNQPTHQKYPVANVDWADAAAYCKWAGKRLPTEAEWEKAARGTDGRLYPWATIHRRRSTRTMGKQDRTTMRHWRRWERSKTARVPMVFMTWPGTSGNGSATRYDTDYYKNSPQQNPEGPPTGGFKVIRGGAWNTSARNLRSSDRYWDPPSFRSLYFPGFRCVKNP